MSKRSTSQTGFVAGDYVAISLDKKSVDLIQIGAAPKSGKIKAELY